MRRTLRFFLCQCLVAGLAHPLTAAAQETRGKISGTVRDSGGVIPGASVKITNTETSVSQALTTNQSGYFDVSQGYVDNTSLSAGSGLGLPLGGTQPTPPSFGGNNYTLDGANNNGSSRRIAASLNQMRVFTFGVRGTF